jgi:hypothetical protein
MEIDFSPGGQTRGRRSGSPEQLAAWFPAVVDLGSDGAEELAAEYSG